LGTEQQTDGVSRKRSDPWRADRIVRGRARQLRRDATIPERLLWSALRDRPGGYRFRRQHPIGPFVVDFCCPEARLVIEVDGETHEDQAAYDEQRTRWLAEQKDYDVLRIGNDEVLKDLEGVYESIMARLRAGPSAGLMERARGRRKPVR
jgi:very-short-patch-repair endonuclease